MENKRETAKKDVEIPNNMKISSKRLSENRIEVNGVIFYTNSMALAVKKYARSPR